MGTPAWATVPRRGGFARIPPPLFGRRKNCPRPSRVSGKFLVAVLGEDETQVPDAIAATWERAVGGELGLHAFLVLSTGEKGGRQLEHKAQWYGKHVRVIGRLAPSSRLCLCGY